MPTWRAWLFIASVAFAGTLYAAWRYVPGFPESLQLLWQDSKAAAKQQLEESDKGEAPGTELKPAK